MFSILDKYIFRFYISYFMLCIIALVGLFLIIKLVDDLDIIIANKVERGIVLFYLIYTVPSIFVEVAPVSVGVAVLITLLFFSRHRELLAIATCGININRFIFTLFPAFLIVSLLLIAVNEQVVPYTNKQAQFIKKVYIEKIPFSDLPTKAMTASYLITSRSYSYFKTTGFSFPFWLCISDDAQLRNPFMMSIGLIDYSGTRLYRVNLLEFTSSFDDLKSDAQIDMIVYSKQTSKWIGTHCIKRTFLPSGLTIKTDVLSNIPVNLPFSTQDFSRLVTKSEEMNIPTLYNHIKIFKKIGYISSALVTDFYFRFVIILSPIILGINLLGFCFSSYKTSKIAIPFVYGFSIIFLYYALYSLSLALGRGGILPPIVAVLLSPIISSIYTISQIKKFERK